MKNKYQSKELQSDTDANSHSDEDTFHSQSNTGSVDLYLMETQNKKVL
jgi:hypothetical protein